MHRGGAKFAWAHQYLRYDPIPRAWTHAAKGNLKTPWYGFPKASPGKSEALSMLFKWQSCPWMNWALFLQGLFLKLWFIHNSIMIAGCPLNLRVWLSRKLQKTYVSPLKFDLNHVKVVFFRLLSSKNFVYPSCMSKTSFRFTRKTVPTVKALRNFSAIKSINCYKHWCFFASVSSILFWLRLNNQFKSNQINSLPCLVRGLLSEVKQQPLTFSLAGFRFSIGVCLSLLLKQMCSIDPHQMVFRAITCFFFQFVKAKGRRPKTTGVVRCQIWKKKRQLWHQQVKIFQRTPNFSHDLQTCKDP
jgi:hypothetical protein